MEFGHKHTFAFVVHPLALPPSEAKSAAARSLARVQIWCGGRNLCSGRDEEGEFDALDIPLIDLANWLVEDWDERVYDTALHEVLATFQYRVPIAERWALSASLDLPLEQAESLHRWASVRALEFAATDYLLPNVVFDRVDDAIRVSWSQRSDPYAFIDVSFTPAQGTILVDVADFVAACRELVRTVYAWTRGTDDARVTQLAALLERPPETVGRMAAGRWVPDLDVDAVVPRDELVQLGETGRGGFVSAFLRSSDQALPASAVAACLHLFAKTHTHLDRDALAQLTSGADATMDPMAPWESGLRLARHIRARLAELGICPLDGPVPIEAVLSDLQVQVASLDLATPEVDGVCLMDRDQRTLAILNTGGRLSSTTVGRRSTLAHELCHFAFDAPQFQVVGQADLRRAPDSIIEKRANAFAAELLLPRAIVLDAAEGYTLERSRLKNLARRFGTGMKLAEHQAENAGVRIVQ